MSRRPEATPPSEVTGRLAIGGRTVAYTLVRRPRKTIGLRIDPAGLRVSAPPRARIQEVESLILQHGNWVLKKLDACLSRPSPPECAIVSGTRLPWLGGELCLELTQGRNQAFWSEDGQVLTLALAAGRAPRALLERALRLRVAEILAARLAVYADRLGVPVPSLTLSSARTRWGSCNQRGNIRLNWRLGYFPLPVIDYVVAHELAHLKEMNHSPCFWAVVAQLYPDWQQQRRELKRLALGIPVFPAD